MQISFLYAALKNLDILCCKISSDYLEAPYVDKLWTVEGNEFGSLAGIPI